MNKVASASAPPQNPTPAPATWLTIADVMQLLNVSRTTVWRWTRDSLRTVRRGGVVRIHCADLHDFLGR